MSDFRHENLVFIRIVPVFLKETAREMFKTLKFTIFPEIFIY